MKQFITGLKTMIMMTFVIVFLASCNNDEFVFIPESSANLVIVTDNDPGSYIMVRILGELRSNFPNIQITYLPAKQFDVFEGAFLMNTALQSFPDGTVIAGILEPGANSRRIVFECGSKRVIAPDNTLATWILNDYPETDCYFIENASVLGGSRPEDLSFEDFYAKALCSLISGTKVSGFGSICLNPNTFEVQEAVIKGDTISGQVLFTDSFGNCTTNIPDKLISQIPVGTIFLLQSDSVQLNIELGLTYSSVPVGENVCFFNSSNLLDLSVNYGNFSEKYNIAAGSQIKLIKLR